MNIKIIIVVLVLIGIFGYIWKSNNADKERLAQAEITHQQKLEAEKVVNLKKEYDEKIVDKDTVKQVVSAKLNEAPEISNEQILEIKNIILEWMDASTVAGATSRIALSQPVSRMQEIKRELSNKKYLGCIESTRLLYIDAMTTNINAYLEFMKGREYELQAMSLLVDYNKHIKIAENEKENCTALRA